MLSTHRLARLTRWLLVAASLLPWATADAAPGRRGSSGLKPLWAGLAPDDVTIDGVPREWVGDWRLLDQSISGGGTSQLQARVLLATSRDSLYLAAEIQGDAQIGDGDRVELLVGFPGGSLRTILLYPGVPGRSRAKATLGGGVIRGAKVVEAPVANGYTLEAQIPWSSLPESKTLQIGLRGAVFVHDAEKSRSGETVVGTAPTREWAALPAISTQPEIELSHGLLLEKGMWQPPAYNLLGNLHGDGLKERVLVYGRYLVVLGPRYRGGSEYYFRDLGVDADQGELPRCELQDVTGDGLADIVLRKRVRQGQSSIDVLEVLTLQGGAEAPERAFAEEVAVKTAQGSFENTVRLSSRRIVVEVPSGAENRAFRLPFRTDAEPPLLPWGPVASQIFTLSGSKFVKSDESKRNGSSGESAPPVAPTVGPTGPAPAPSGDQAYDQYRRERGAGGKARFKVSANLLGDAKPERVVLHERDLVVYGPGFRDGVAYAVVTLPFAAGDDVSSVKTRELTGDGLAEIVVEGVMRAQAPADAGGGEVTRKVVLVYQLGESSLRRVFGAELERAIGPNKVLGNIDFAPGQIVLRPGRAVGFTAQTYPFPQEVGASGGIEPLLLPWSGAKPVPYRWDGQRFAP